MFKLFSNLLVVTSSVFCLSALANDVPAPQPVAPQPAAPQKSQSFLRRIDEHRVGLSIFTPKEEGVQAASYVNGDELKSVIELLIQDPTTDLAKLKKEIETKACAGVAVQNIPQDCGSVQFTVSAQTSFGRDGWMGGGAAWTTFIGFREIGTGRFFEVQFGFVINEDVEAQVDKDDDYTGELVKTYTYNRSFPFDSRANFRIPVRGNKNNSTF